MKIEESKNPGDFSTFELAGWDKTIAGYDNAFGAVARQTVAPLLDAAQVTRGSRLLDVCTGPGMAVAGALARGADATGVDFSGAAIAHARKIVAGGRFQQGDAQALPYADASFDAVVCGYGLMHLPDPAQGLAEMRRVLKPGGRVAISVWSAESSSFGLIYAAVRACGNPDVKLPHGPDFFQFGTVPKMEAALNAVGFDHVAAGSFDQTWHFDTPDRYFEATLSGTVRAAAVLGAQTGAAATSVRDYIRQQLTNYKIPSGGYALPMPAMIGSGTKPQ